MFKEFFTLEVRNHLKQPMVYIFFALLALLTFMATYADGFTIGGSTGNVNKNSPFVIAQYTVVLGTFGILIITAFMDFAALRDYKHNYHQILFSTPVRKAAYLFGRFFGAYLVALLPFLGIFVGIMLGSIWPGVNTDKVGPFLPSAYLASFLTFVVPNTLFLGALVFLLAVRFKNTTASFIGAVVVFVAYLTATSFLSDLDNETVATLLDPLGISAFDVLTRYWTVAEKNTLAIFPTGTLLLNRLLWIGVGVLFLALAYVSFSFADRARRSKSQKKEAFDNPIIPKLAPLPPARVRTDRSAHWQQFANQVKMELWGTLKSSSFIIIMFIALANAIANLWYVAEGSGNTINYPVTYEVTENLEGSLGLFLMIIIVYFSGVMVWKERDAKMDGFFDAYAYPSWVLYLSKVVTLTGLVIAIQLLGIAAGLVTQLVLGYRDIDLSLYFTEFFAINLPYLLMIIILSVLIQSLVKNKFIGYALVIGFIIVNGPVLRNVLDIRHNLLIFTQSPNYTYSDMNGYGPFAAGVFWFKSYWLLFCGFLVVLSLLFWVRGKETSLKARLRIARQRFNPAVRNATLAIAALWVLVGGFIFYNTNILNDYVNPETIKEIQADYEKQYKRYQGTAQPRIKAVSYEIDLEPYQRNVYAQATVTLKNLTGQPIDSLHLNYTNDGIRLREVELPTATLAMDDDRLGYRIYRLSPALAPGDSLTMVVRSAYESRGFENEVSLEQITQNGTFFNTHYFMPTLGYNKDAELSDRDDRQDHDLPPRDRMASIDDTTSYRNNYIANDADWIRMETTISTAPDQVAVAPGSLVKEWEADGKRYFHYQLDKSVLHYSAFISARYEVLRDQWNDVDVEIYYHPTHDYNVERMAEAVKASLAYYGKQFSPYPHAYARIIEFPRYQTFAQAFPGTMPYAESFGFIENLEDDDSKDVVLATVAHEMAHQWWAHQVIGADVQGATMLSETMAEYASLMVMKQQKSEKSANEHRRYEVDRYLRSRGAEELKEVPLWLVEGMGYIHYQKGGTVMYALQDYIGEEKVNQALRDYAQEVAYQEPPYTTSRDLLAHFRAVTPDSLQDFVTDLFENITLYSNRTEEATYKPLDNDRYQVDFTTVSEKFYADSLGAESEVPVNDWIDIGVYTEDQAGKDSLIYVDRRKITQRENTFSVVVNHQPTKAAIDPNALLIDRVPDDNEKKVSAQQEAVAGL